ncbi:putative ABC transporter ATP-binding protein [Streptomyces sp. Tu6071]|nr:putative ABC transporter ATP-binding protein [Streptomyces sp. Tu6071]
MPFVPWWLTSLRAVDLDGESVRTSRPRGPFRAGQGLRGGKGPGFGLIVADGPVPAGGGCSHDHRRGAVDVDDVDGLAGLEGLLGVEGAGRPDLARELDAALAARVDACDDDGLTALEGVDAAGEMGALGALPGGEGAYDGDTRDGDEDEDQYLDHDAAADRGGDRARDGARREHAELRHGGHHEGNPQCHRADQPPHPRVDVHRGMVGARRPLRTGGVEGVRGRFPPGRGAGPPSASAQGEAAGGPAFALLLDDEREAEAAGEVARGEFEFERARGEHLALADHEDVREAGGDLLDVVGHHDHRGGDRVACEAAEAADEVLAAPEVETGGGLVEEEQFGVRHEGAGDERALALSLGESAEAAVEVLGHAEAVEEGAGALLVDVLVRLLPRRRHAVGGGEDGLEDGLAAGQLLGHADSGDADAGAQLEDVDAAEAVAEDADGAGGGEEVAGGHVEEGGLAGAVGAEDDPALPLLHGPGDLVDQSPALADHRYVHQFQYIAHERRVSHCLSRLVAGVVGRRPPGMSPGENLRHRPGEAVACPVLRLGGCALNHVPGG